MIMESKTSYENAFRYCDNDGNDIGYFVAYNLRVLGRAYQKLKEYVNHKQQEKRAATLLMVKGKLTERQSMILQHFRNSPDDMLTVKDVEVNLSVTTMTARKDLSYLVREGYLEEVPINNIKRGYIRSERFDELINNR
jgi:Fic family protein